ncbi:hypothetical protein JTB14_021137 [Gonioctena quinquepunctata]|nr:hypothetical protein JTB14_021137 [Gonioctena quinquepunctata]
MKKNTKKGGGIKLNKKDGRTKMSTLHKGIKKQSSSSEDEIPTTKDKIAAKRKEIIKRNVFQSKKPKVQVMDISDSEQSKGSFSCADTESSLGSFISSDEGVMAFQTDDEDSVEINMEIMFSKGLEIMSIGQINGKTETTVKVTYIRRLFPTFIFSSSNLAYILIFPKLL